MYFLILILLAENDDDASEKGMIPFNEKTIPDNIISLEAGDTFIKNCVMKLPDILTAGTKNSEECIINQDFIN